MQHSEVWRADGLSECSEGRPQARLQHNSGQKATSTHDNTCTWTHAKHAGSATLKGRVFQTRHTHGCACTQCRGVACARAGSATLTRSSTHPKRGPSPLSHLGQHVQVALLQLQAREQQDALPEVGAPAAAQVPLALRLQPARPRVAQHLRTGWGLRLGHRALGAAAR